MNADKPEHSLLLAALDAPAKPRPRLEKLRLVVPPGQGKQAEVLGEGPEAAPKVVEMMREIGVA